MLLANRSFSSILLAIVLFVLVRVAWADCERPGDVLEPCDNGFSINTDQDLLAIDFLTDFNEDRDYTMGLEVAYHGYRVTQWPFFSVLQKGINKIERIRTNEDDFPSLAMHTVKIGDTAFTPDRLDTTEIQFGDRPYSNLFYLSLAEMKVYEMEQKAISNLLVVGVLGSDIGKGFQRQVHCDWKLSKQCPVGWSNQISDGGELTLLWRHSILNNVKSSFGEENDWGSPEVTIYRELDVGYYTDVAAGFNLRFGRIRSEFYTHSSNPLSSVNHASADRSSELYFFLSGGIRLFLYNALLQGQFRDNDYDLSYDDINPRIGEGSIGFVWARKSFVFRYALNYRSSEIEEGTGDREHWFGGIYVDIIRD